MGGPGSGRRPEGGAKKPQPKVGKKKIINKKLLAMYKAKVKKKSAVEN